MSKKRYRWIGWINRIWAYVFFSLLLMPPIISYEEKLDRNGLYIFCPNHFSYLDIPAMGLNKVNTIFVGKSDMETIPLFGWMYRMLHITVNRESLKSKYSTFIRGQKAIEDGKSLVIYPEGGIITTNPPEMVKFKDGAFKIAVNTQKPIVPVSIINNWIILPDNLLLGWAKLRMVFHTPISTEGMTESDIPELKKRVADIISGELSKYYDGNN